MQAKLFDRRRGQPPGFRIDSVDIGFIALLAALTATLWVLMPYYGLQWLPLYLGTTFFLFCNVFRIGNRLEPLWYVPFTLVSIYCLYTLQISLLWQIVTWFLEPLKWALIVYRIVRGPYVGVFSRLGSARP
jgi:hypothetical protein